MAGQWWQGSLLSRPTTTASGGGRAGVTWKDCRVHVAGKGVTTAPRILIPQRRSWGAGVVTPALEESDSVPSQDAFLMGEEATGAGSDRFFNLTTQRPLLFPLPNKILPLGKMRPEKTLISDLGGYSQGWGKKILYSDKENHSAEPRGSRPQSLGPSVGDTVLSSENQALRGGAS